MIDLDATRVLLVNLRGERRHCTRCRARYASIARAYYFYHHRIIDLNREIKRIRADIAACKA